MQNNDFHLDPHYNIPVKALEQLPFLNQAINYKYTLLSNFLYFSNFYWQLYVNI